MAKSYVRDMTDGGIVRHLVIFALPMLAGNLFQQLYNMVDSIVVGRFVGANALGAVGSIGSINFLFISLCLGLASGVGIMVSQYFGAGRDDLVKTCIAQAVYVTLAGGLLMSALAGGLARPILTLLQVPEENFADALTYMRIVCGSSIIIAIYNSISAIMRALGDSKTPLIFLIVASIMNIALDLILVIVCHMGVAGVAWATVISQAVSAIGSILWGIWKNPYLKLNKDHFIPHKNVLIRELKIGLPLAIQSATIAISCVALQGVVNTFGPTVMAAYTASNRIEQLVQQPYNSLGMSLATFAGQNFGAGKKDRIKKSAMIGMSIALGFSLLMVTVMYTLGKPIVGIFISDVEVIFIGSSGLRISSLMYIFLGMIYVMRGLLNGVGDTAFSMINGLCEVVARIGLALLLIFVFHMSYMAVWYVNGFTWAFTGLISALRFYTGNWRKKDIHVQTFKAN